MSLKQKIDQDLKTAMLEGDKKLVSIYRGMKSSILDREVALGKREEGLSDEEVVTVLQKESKKRQEAANIYKDAGQTEREKSELDEKVIIDNYLPQRMSEEEVVALINEIVNDINDDTELNQGKIIGLVLQKSKGSADGAIVSRLVRERLNK